MPIATSNILGLVILSLGLLGVVISLLITDRKRFMIALSLSGLIVFTGVYQYVNIGIRQWQASRRIAQLQEQQRSNLQSLQERLRQAQSRTTETSTQKPSSSTQK